RPAGALRVRSDREAGVADDRAEGQHRDRQGRRPAGAEEEARELSEPRPRGCPAISARDPRRISRARTCAADPGSGAVPPGAAEGNQIASAHLGCRLLVLRPILNEPLRSRSSLSARVARNGFLSLLSPSRTHGPFASETLDTLRPCSI